MEPKRPEVNTGHEQPAVSFDQFQEQGPNVVSPERGMDRGSERAEQGVAATPMHSGTIPALPSIPQPVAPAPPVQPIAQPEDDTPSVAADDDLIEKEWVDKAKKVISQTKDDPYRREQEISKLQADYLRKRYGRELGGPQ